MKRIVIKNGSLRVYDSGHELAYDHARRYFWRFNDRQLEVDVALMKELFANGDRIYRNSRNYQSATHPIAN